MAWAPGGATLQPTATGDGGRCTVAATYAVGVEAEATTRERSVSHCNSSNFRRLAVL